MATPQSQEQLGFDQGFPILDKESNLTDQQQAKP